MKDPHFYFSREICLETAVTILNYPSSEFPTTNQVLDNMIRDDYAQLKIVSGSFFKSFILYLVMKIFQELYTQIEEEGPTFTHETNASRETLKQCLRDIIDLSVDRITVGENNVKGHLFISVVLAQVEAMEEGINPEPVVLESAKKSSLFCYDLLSTSIAKVKSSLPINASSSGVFQDFRGLQDFGMDFTMQDWSMDQDIQGS